MFVSVKPLVPKALDTASNFGETVSSSFTGMWESIFGEKEDVAAAGKITAVIITEAQVNIRATPSLDGKVIATGYAGEKYNYLDQEKVDAQGVTWLYVQLPDGRKGYVSKKVVQME